MKRPACSERQTGACRSCGPAACQPCRGHEEPVGATDLSARGRRTPTDLWRTGRRERSVPGVQRQERLTPSAEPESSGRSDQLQLAGRVSSGRRTNVNSDPQDWTEDGELGQIRRFDPRCLRRTNVKLRFSSIPSWATLRSCPCNREITHPGFYGGKPWRKPNSEVIVAAHDAAGEGLGDPFPRLPPNRSQKLNGNPVTARTGYRHNSPKVSLFRSSRFLIALRVSKSAVLRQLVCPLRSRPRRGCLSGGSVMSCSSSSVSSTVSKRSFSASHARPLPFVECESFSPRHSTTSQLPGPAPVYQNAGRQALSLTSQVQFSVPRRRHVLTQEAVQRGINEDVATAGQTPNTSRHQEILELLRARLEQIGFVPRYDGLVDCIVEAGDADIYFEVKSASPESVVHQVRTGLGQVLHYMWMDADSSPRTIRGHLVVEGPWVPQNESLQDFLESRLVRLTWSRDISSLEISDVNSS